ncbi:unnamed protein product [Cunninghamella blakesleeana]
MFLTPYIYHLYNVISSPTLTSNTSTSTSSSSPSLLQPYYLYQLYQQNYSSSNVTMFTFMDVFKYSSNVFQWNDKSILLDSISLSLLTGMALYLWAFLTRWHFAVLYIGVLDSPFKNQCLRYAGSILFILLGYLSMNGTLQSKKNNEICSMFSTLCFVLGLLWQYSGPYFYKRKRAMMMSISFSTLMATIYQQSLLPYSSSSSMFYHWQIQDWFMLMLTVVSTSCLIDNADAILNTYPQLITLNIQKQSELQTPYTWFYWKSLFMIVTDVLPNQHELCADPITDLLKVIDLLGPASRSWKTMAALFPVNLRQDLCILYGFFRACDDLVDDPPTMERKKKT